MFDYRKIQESAAAAVLAVVLSATAIGATISPAQADDAGRYVYVQASVAQTHG
ncbi:MAG TPA: hypothetical protein VFP12_07740 [Allosphingosinicella sp.]|nr:hypothetical protein [Allosphingosinicella sp.]